MPLPFRVSEPALLARRAAAVLVWAAVLALAALPARSAPLPAAGACSVPGDLLTSTEKLPRVARKLAHDEPVKIVAFGSSSTAGVGASRPQASYPSQMQQELQRLFPRSKITVVNKGISGEDVREMMTRFQRDVLDQRPDLLLWQTGTNSALHHNKVASYTGKLTQGIDMARAAGIDVLLMTPQLSPKFLAVPNHQQFLDHITTIGSLHRVPVIRRYEIMKYWLDSGEMTQAEMINRDGLHQTDRSYHCLGMLAAHMVAGLADRPALAGVTVARQTRE